jgi:hypothetical protein
MLSVVIVEDKIKHMKVTVLCDRCKREYWLDENSLADITRPANWEYGIGKDSTHKTPYVNKKDLICDDCQEDADIF